jgi:hypothetical protein
MKKEKMKKICLRCTEHTFYNSEREADSSVSGGKATDKIKSIVSTCFYYDKNHVIPC